MIFFKNVRTYLLWKMLSFQLIQDGEKAMQINVNAHDRFASVSSAIILELKKVKDKSLSKLIDEYENTNDHRITVLIALTHLSMIVPMRNVSVPGVGNYKPTKNEAQELFMVLVNVSNLDYQRIGCFKYVGP